MQGLSIVKPPYGVLTAVNLDRGEIVWQVPHGDTPDNIRTHPALKGLNIGKTGQPGTSGVGLMVTKTVVVAFGGFDELTVAAGLFALPIALWELGLGLWLTFKGFREVPALEVVEREPAFV